MHIGICTHTCMRQLKSGLYDPSPNLILRKIGHGCYMVDADGIQYMFLPGGETKTVCIFDWKHFREESISFDNDKCESAPGLKCQRDLANREKVPFFIGITYTKPEDGYGEGQQHPPMFCLIPGNWLANQALQTRGTWFTPRDMGKLLVNLRGKTIDDQQLMHLPHTFVKYKIQTDIDSVSLKANWAREKELFGKR